MRKTLHEVNTGESPLLVTHGGGERGSDRGGDSHVQTVLVTSSSS